MFIYLLLTFGLLDDYTKISNITHVSKLSISSTKRIKSRCNITSYSSSHRTPVTVNLSWGILALLLILLGMDIELNPGKNHFKFSQSISSLFKPGLFSSEGIEGKFDICSHLDPY